MSSDYYGGIAGEIVDAGYEIEPDDEYLEREAERRALIHQRQEHGGGECDCPVSEPEYSEEPPF